MEEHKITITEVLTKTIAVDKKSDALTIEDAMAYVENEYNQGEIVLDESDS